MLNLILSMNICQLVEPEIEITVTVKRQKEYRFHLMQTEYLAYGVDLSYLF